MSHITKVSIELRNKIALAAAVVSMSGAVIGEGTHNLYGRQAVSGFGFTLPLWKYPLVLEGSTLAYDDFLAKPGYQGDIAKLTGRYAVEAAREAATNQGWMSEDVATGLLIHHPSGATMTVGFDGLVEANGFVGSLCDVTAGIEAAIGSQIERVNKDEYFGESAHIRH